MVETMPAEYAPSDLVRDMRRITARTDDGNEIVRLLTAPARRLALAKGWLEPRFLQRDEAQGFAIYPLHEEPDHRLSVVVASLLPGRGLPPHNHRIWAMQIGIVGHETNVAWRRTDDGRRPGHAEIVEAGRTVFGPGEVVTFAPDDIHSVVNETDEIALSLNLYGLSYGYTHASRFDPIAQTESPLIPA
jgi:predicted metal-dependent enzyme (double-stranded beta helix superfamily)